MNDDLLDSAFGSHCDDRSLETSVPRIPRPLDVWMYAVALGARGFYAGAATQLDRLLRSTDDPTLRSLATSTRASHLRQSGRHAGALRYEGEALRLVVSVDSDPVACAAHVDAIVGLAADCLGTGQLDLADRLLARAERTLDDAAPGSSTPPVAADAATWMWVGRPRLRHAWVCTELSLYRGEPEKAHAAGVRAGRLAATAPSVRHRIKTDLIIAAATASAGDMDTAVIDATTCANSARAHNQLPLEWAAQALLAGLGVRSAVARESALRTAVNRRGGGFGR